jgi:sulfur-oxidizing protein SoxZ
MATALLYVPKTAKKGEVITLKAVFSHPMETGYRRDVQGRTIPRDIISKFSCRYDGAEVFRVDFHPAIAANPFISFSTAATMYGPIVFTWTNNAGARPRSSWWRGEERAREHHAPCRCCPAGLRSRHRAGGPPLGLRADGP